MVRVRLQLRRRYSLGSERGLVTVFCTKPGGNVDTDSIPNQPISQLTNQSANLLSVCPSVTLNVDSGSIPNSIVRQPRVVYQWL